MKICPKCGAENDDEDMMCKSCGTTIVSNHLQKMIDSVNTKKRNEKIHNIIFVLYYIIYLIMFIFDLRQARGRILTMTIAFAVLTLFIAIALEYHANVFFKMGNIVNTVKNGGSKIADYNKNAMRKLAYIIYAISFIVIMICMFKPNFIMILFSLF